MIPNARAKDPISSYLAGRDVESSGSAIKQRLAAHAAVLQYPGMTSRELSQLTGLCRYMLARRLPEICIIEKGKPRICSESRRVSLTWWPKGSRP